MISIKPLLMSQPLFLKSTKKVWLYPKIKLQNLIRWIKIQRSKPWIKWIKSKIGINLSKFKNNCKIKFLSQKPNKRNKLRKTLKWTPTLIIARISLRSMLKLIKRPLKASKKTKLTQIPSKMTSKKHNFQRLRPNKLKSKKKSRKRSRKLFQRTVQRSRK